MLDLIPPKQSSRLVMSSEPGPWGGRTTMKVVDQSCDQRQWSLSGPTRLRPFRLELQSPGHPVQTHGALRAGQSEILLSSTSAAPNYGCRTKFLLIPLGFYLCQPPGWTCVGPLAGLVPVSWLGLRSVQMLDLISPKWSTRLAMCSEPGLGPGEYWLSPDSPLKHTN